MPNGPERVYRDKDLCRSADIAKALEGDAYCPVKEALEPICTGILEMMDPKIIQVHHGNSSIR